MRSFILQGRLTASLWSAHFSMSMSSMKMVLGFCNNIYNAEGGTHLTGFKTTFTTLMNNYAQRAGYPERKGRQFYRCGYP